MPIQTDHARLSSSPRSRAAGISLRRGSVWTGRAWSAARHGTVRYPNSCRSRGRDDLEAKGPGTGAQGQTPMTQVFVGASPGLESIATHRGGPTSVEGTGERVRILAIMAQNRGGG